MTQLPTFYKNIVVNWTKVKPINLTTKDQIKQECLWVNSLILSDNKPLYYKTCLKNNLLFINDILKENGDFKSLEQVNYEFNVNLNFIDYLRIRQCIPNIWKKILNNNLKEDKTTDIHFNKLKRYNTLKCSTIYWLTIPLKHNITIEPNSHQYWRNLYKLDTLSDYLQLCFSCIRITFIQALQYKIINRIYNCNAWLHKLKIVENPKCRFCDEIENIEPFFLTAKKQKNTGGPLRTGGIDLIWLQSITWMNKQ